MFNSSIKSQRFQLRLTPETYYRLKMLADYKNVSVAQIIESLVDDAWLDNYVIPGFRKKNE